MVNIAWETVNARWAVVSPTVTAADDGGCWWLLTEKIIPEWIAGGFGMEWVTAPRQHGVTKKLFCEVTNSRGGKSRFQLDSLQYEEEAENRFKNKNYSGIYVSELDYFKKQSTFSTLCMALRGPDWTDDDLTFIGDTNPAEEGTDSWIYRHWFDFRVQEGVNDEQRAQQEKMALVEFTTADNIFERPEVIAERLSVYSHSEDLMRRYRDGQWVKATGNSVFFQTFMPNFHVVGELASASNPTPDVIIPEENCSELILGFDPGEGANHAMTLMEKVWHDSGRGREVPTFKILDECVYIGEDVSLDQFIWDCMEVVEEWEGHIGHRVNLRCWSDRSVFDRKTHISNIAQHQAILQASEGRFVMQAADRSPGSVRVRVELTRKLLFEGRIFISRSRCPNLIESFQALRPGKGQKAIDPVSRMKHSYDSASYAFCSETWTEMVRPRKDLRVGKPGLVSIDL